MSQLCKNCNAPLEGNFCNNCGQSSKTEPINFHSFLHEVGHILHFENGFFHTLKEIIVRPGTTVRNYIKGQRVRHIKPISLLFLMGILNSIAFHYLENNNMLAVEIHTDYNKMADTILVNMVKAIQHLLIEQSAKLQVLLVLLWSFCSYLVFRKKGYNFFEHLVTNAYRTSQYLFFSIILMGISFLIFRDDTATRADYFRYTDYAVFYFLMFRFNILFFESTNKARIVFKTILSILFYLLLLLLILFVTFFLLYFTGI